MDHSISYYVVLDDKSQGPYSVRALEMLARQKKINDETFVCPEGGTDWVAYKIINNAEQKEEPNLKLPGTTSKPTLPGASERVNHAAAPAASVRRAVIVEEKGNNELVKECDGFLSGSILVSWGKITIICSLIIFIIGVIIGFTFLGDGGILNFIVLVSALMASIMIGVSWAAFGYIVRCQATIVRLLAQIADK